MLRLVLCFGFAFVPFLVLQMFVYDEWAVGLYPFFSFPFLLLFSFCSISQLSFVSGDEG